jgi:hypothetical protein
MHRLLHCDVMITFIGLDKLSAAPAVVIPSHTAKVTTKKEGSPKPYARTPGPWMFNQTRFVNGEEKRRGQRGMQDGESLKERDRISANLWNCSVTYCTVQGNDVRYKTYT